MRFATKAVHAGLEPEPAYGGVVPPIHQATTYVQAGPGEFVEDFDYSRSANPTRAALERALGELEGGLASAFSSGMAAEHALITAVCSAGDHVVLPDDLYGGTYRLVDKVLKRWGLEYTMVDQTDLDAVEAAVREKAMLINSVNASFCRSLSSIASLLEARRSRSRAPARSQMVY